MFGAQRRYLHDLADAICRRPAWFVMAGLLIAVASAIFSTRHLDFKTSRNDLIGRDSEYWRLYTEYTREFRSEEDYIVVVESGNPARNRRVVINCGMHC
jgi:predicted RND superfamily exporter protein